MVKFEMLAKKSLAFLLLLRALTLYIFFKLGLELELKNSEM
jgi:hypothetical protein